MWRYNRHVVGFSKINDFFVWIMLFPYLKPWWEANIFQLYHVYWIKDWIGISINIFIYIHVYIYVRYIYLRKSTGNPQRNGKVMNGFISNRKAGLSKSQMYNDIIFTCNFLWLFTYNMYSTVLLYDRRQCCFPYL